MRFVTHENLRDASVPFFFALFFYWKWRNVHDAEAIFWGVLFGMVFMRVLLYLGAKAGRQR